MIFLTGQNLQLLFADDTLLFSTVYDPIMSADQLDKDLKKTQTGHANGK